MLAGSAFIFQHKELSTAAWVVLILLILFILILNFSLISALRKKDNPSTRVLNRFVMSIKQPDRRDEKMRQELNERVERLPKNTSPPNDK